MVAEIVEWSTRKTTRLMSGAGPGVEHVEVREKVMVRSGRFPGAMDVSVLRAMVAALDAAKIPGRALVEAAIDGERVVQLSVEHDLEAPPVVSGDGVEQLP